MDDYIPLIALITFCIVIAQCYYLVITVDGINGAYSSRVYSLLFVVELMRV